MGGPKPRGKGSYDRMGGPEGGGSYDKMGGPKPRGKGCTNWEPLLMATAAGIGCCLHKLLPVVYQRRVFLDFSSSCSSIICCFYHVEPS